MARSLLSAAGQWTPEEKAALMAEVEAEGGHDDEAGVRRVDG